MRDWILLLLVLSGSGLAGCRNCKDIADEADDFVRDRVHQACSTDDDCVAVQVGCANMDTQGCGEVLMNRDAAASKTWEAILEDLDHCKKNRCHECSWSVPQCVTGTCRWGH